MRRIIRILLFVFITILIYSFKKVVFKRSKKYFYETIYIKPNGDTLAQESFTWDPRGVSWPGHLIQTSVILKYCPDSLNTINVLPPVTRHRLRREVLLKKYEEKGMERGVESKE